MLDIEPSIEKRKNVAGEVLLKLKGHWTKEAKKEILKGDYDVLVIGAGSWEGFRFFEEISKNIKNLYICDQLLEDVTEKYPDLGGIAYLTELEKIVIQSPSDYSLDFSALTNLKVCEISPWGILYSNNLFLCPKLETLFITHYTIKSLENIAKAKNLKSLVLRQSPIPDLNGIDNLKKLEELELYDVKKLATIDGIEKLKKLKKIKIGSAPQLLSIAPLGKCETLEDLNINNLKRVEDFNALASILALSRLYIDVKELDSLNLLKSLPKMKTLVFANTNIVDGNIEILKDFPSLKEAHFRNKRHYNYNNEDVDEWFKNAI